MVGFVVLAVLLLLFFFLMGPITMWASSTDEDLVTLANGTQASVFRFDTRSNVAFVGGGGGGCDS